MGNKGEKIRFHESKQRNFPPATVNQDTRKLIRLTLSIASSQAKEEGDDPGPFHGLIIHLILFISSTHPAEGSALSSCVASVVSRVTRAAK